MTDEEELALEEDLADIASGYGNGYGVRGDVRKRHTHYPPHPDPAVCELIAKAWDEGWRDAGYHQDVNPYRESS